MSGEPPSARHWDEWFQALPASLVPTARSETAKGMGFNDSLAPVEQGTGVNGLRLTDPVTKWLASMDWTVQQLEQTVRGRATASPFPGDPPPSPLPLPPNLLRPDFLRLQIQTPT